MKVITIKDPRRDHAGRRRGAPASARRTAGAVLPEAAGTAREEGSMTAPRRDPRGSIARVTAVSGRYAPSEAGMSVAIGDVRPLLALLAGDGVFAAGLSWQDDAPCGQADGDAWFPEKGELSRSAKMICRSCPARLDCLRYALDRNEEYGVWGGLSWEERRNAARARKRGASLEQVAADADAAWDAVMAAAADHAREIGRMGAELALADRDQSGEVAA